jgi:hypothetical protein
LLELIVLETIRCKLGGEEGYTLIGQKVNFWTLPIFHRVGGPL